MIGDNEKLVREKGFDFFGSITASLSHEINNVFAIINELSGLLDDFFVAADKGAELNLERLKSATERIAAQVSRGETYIKQLNRFAHTVDEQRVTIELNESVEAITTLCQRFGVLRRVQIDTHYPEISPQLSGNPFNLQHVVFRSIRMLLAASQQGDTVSIQVEAQNDGARFSFSGGSPLESLEAFESERSFLDVLVEKLEGKLETRLQVGQKLQIVIVLPHTLRALSKGRVDEENA